MLNQTPETSGAIGCKSRLLFAKIAMAIWFQVSGVRKHVQFFIDLKILHVHIIAMGHLVFPLILKPEEIEY